MTKDDIIRMALESDLLDARDDLTNPTHIELITYFERFAKLVAAAERETCAVICDGMILYTGYDCAAAIRSWHVYKMGWPIGDPRDILKSAKPRSQS